MCSCHASRGKGAEAVLRGTVPVYIAVPCQVVQRLYLYTGELSILPYQVELGAHDLLRTMLSTLDRDLGVWEKQSRAEWTGVRNACEGGFIANAQIC